MFTFPKHHFDPGFIFAGFVSLLIRRICISITDRSVGLFVRLISIDFTICNARLSGSIILLKRIWNISVLDVLVFSYARYWVARLTCIHYPSSWIWRESRRYRWTISTCCSSRDYAAPWVSPSPSGTPCQMLGRPCSPQRVWSLYWRLSSKAVQRRNF